MTSPHLITLAELTTRIRDGVHFFISYPIPRIFIAGILYRNNDEVELVKEGWNIIWYHGEVNLQAGR